MNLYKRSLCFNAIHTVLSSRNVNGMTPEILYNKNFHLPHNFFLIKSVLFLSLARFLLILVRLRQRWQRKTEQKYLPCCTCAVCSSICSQSHWDVANVQSFEKQDSVTTLYFLDPAWSLVLSTLLMDCPLNWVSVAVFQKLNMFFTMIYSVM